MDVPNTSSRTRQALQAIAQQHRSNSRALCLGAFALLGGLAVTAGVQEQFGGNLGFTDGALETVLGLGMAIDLPLFGAAFGYARAGRSVDNSAKKF